MSNPSTQTAYSERFTCTGEGTYAYMNRPTGRVGIGSVKLQLPQIVALGDTAASQAFTFYCVVNAVGGIKNKSVDIISKTSALSSTMNQDVIGDTTIADYRECMEDQMMILSKFTIAVITTEASFLRVRGVV